ncbi:uncharacterized protein LOC120195606 [Hibiscus syriacus]|uniref:uncharacterized protein LOC120195606 n=1 Tax=Hibiscus syriacus TaxID=106335 RepID=UPI001921245E|nr:uncharacterized protein LOC120195606 [Hibiscus syriacus]
MTSAEWKRSKYARKIAELEMMEVINSTQFWEKVGDVLKIQEPLVKVLRMCDGDENQLWVCIYEAMDRAKLAIRRDYRYYQKYWEVIDRRWSNQLHNDLHSTGYFLNPQFLYGGNSTSDMIYGIMNGVRNVIQRIEPNLNDQSLEMKQLLLYRDKTDSFGTPLAQAAILKTNPAEWWTNYGNCALQRIVVRVLSQITSFSNFEAKTHEKKSAQELEMGFNPINLENIFEDDPLNSWAEERQDAMLNSEQNFSWLPEELINEADEEIQGEDMHDISPTPSNDESVQLSTSSGGGDDGGDGGGGDDHGGDNEGLYGTNTSTGSSSYSLAINDNEISESSQGIYTAWINTQEDERKELKEVRKEGRKKKKKNLLPHQKVNGN